MGLLDIEIIGEHERSSKLVALLVSRSTIIAVKKGAVTGEGDQVTDRIGQATA